jgi:hypothetical protein|tara:strand:+ start:64 stop:861 length:798 start_codon:yes stop_codon:yes gene_type:complete
MPSEFDTISTQITKPSPVIEGSLSNFLPFIDMLSKGAVDSSFSGINTANYDPKVAQQDALQKQAAANAAGLGSLTGTGAGTGAGSIASYMSPYQQQVIDASLSEFDRNAAIQNQGVRDSAIQAGAYGGGREGVQLAEMQRGNQMNRAQLQAQLLNQGFGQAQQARAGDLQAQQGLGTYQSQMGAGQQGFEQAKLDASQIAAREAEFAPFTQLGLVGQQLAQIQPGAFPTQTVGYAPPAAPASPMSQFLGAGAGIGGMMGKLGMFG